MVGGKLGKREKQKMKQEARRRNAGPIGLSYLPEAKHVNSNQKNIELVQ